MASKAIHVTNGQNVAAATKKSMATSSKFDSKISHEGRTLGQTISQLHYIPCLIFVASIIFAGEVLQYEPAKRFYTLYGNIQGTQLYQVHPYDINFVVFFFFSLTFLRWFASQFIFLPFSDLFGIKSARKILKVQEAGWQFLYYASSISLGLYTIKDEPYFFNTKYFWLDYPHIQISILLKRYYLFQTAFWFHMVFVWSIETKRKDYLQMISHHIITIMMVTFSYTYNWTYIGSAFLLNLDCADILLYLAKLINYAKYQVLSNATFVVFVIVWILTRHYLFCIIALSVWYDGYNLPFKWDHATGYYWTPFVYYIFMFGFLMLQLLFILWFVTIIKLVIRVITSPADVKDTRSSDDEDDKPKQK